MKLPSEMVVRVRRGRLGSEKHRENVSIAFGDQMAIGNGIDQNIIFQGQLKCQYRNSNRGN